MFTHDLKEIREQDRLRPVATWPSSPPFMFEEGASIDLTPSEVEGAVKVLRLLTGLLRPFQDSSDGGWAMYMPLLTGLVVTCDENGWKLGTRGLLTMIERGPTPTDEEKQAALEAELIAEGLLHPEQASRQEEGITGDHGAVPR